MAANYWASSQRLHWQFTREKLAEVRNQLDAVDKEAVKLFPLPERRHLSIYFNIRKFFCFDNMISFLANAL